MVLTDRPSTSSIALKRNDQTRLVDLVSLAFVKKYKFLTVCKLMILMACLLATEQQKYNTRHYRLTGKHCKQPTTK